MITTSFLGQGLLSLVTRVAIDAVLANTFKTIKNVMFRPYLSMATTFDLQMKCNIATDMAPMRMQHTPPLNL